MMFKDEYKDDGFFNEKGDFEFAKCSSCGGPKIGHSKRNEKNCVYDEFLNGKSWSDEDVKYMEDRIRKMKGFKDAMMMRLMQDPEALSIIIGIYNRVWKNPT